MNLICHHIKLVLFYYKTWKENIVAIRSLYFSEIVLNFIVKLTYCLLRPLFVSGTSRSSSWFLIPWENILLNPSWDADFLCLGLNLTHIPQLQSYWEKGRSVRSDWTSALCEPSSPSLQGTSLPEATMATPAAPSRNKAWYDGTAVSEFPATLHCDVAVHLRPSSKLKDNCS